MFNPATIRNDILQQPHDYEYETKNSDFEFFKIEHDAQIHWAVCVRRTDVNSPVLWLHNDGRLYSVINRTAKGNCGSGYFESEASLRNALQEYKEAETGWIELNEDSIELVQLGALCLIKMQNPDGNFATPMSINIGVFANVESRELNQSEAFMKGLGIAPQSGGPTKQYKAFVTTDGKDILASVETITANLQASGFKTYYKDIDLS